MSNQFLEFVFDSILESDGLPLESLFGSFEALLGLLGALSELLYWTSLGALLALSRGSLGLSLGSLGALMGCLVALLWPLEALFLFGGSWSLLGHEAQFWPMVSCF